MQFGGGTGRARASCLPVPGCICFLRVSRHGNTVGDVTPATENRAEARTWRGSVKGQASQGPQGEGRQALSKQHPESVMNPAVGAMGMSS